MRIYKDCMTDFLRTCLALTLALLLGVTAQGAAVARGMPGASGQMELCTGTGPVMVYIDENGKPTAPPHLCPKFAPLLILSLGIADFDLSIAETAGRIDPDAVTVSVTDTDLPVAMARGPPWRV